MKRWGVVFFLLVCFPLVYSSKAQNISNEGTDFWAVFPTHDPANNQGNIREANITIWVTSKFESEVTVSCNGVVVGNANTTIQPNRPLAFEVPRNLAYIAFSEQNSNLTNRGIHVVVSPGKPKVAVYSHIFAGLRSAASLILPYESLGQRYFSMNYTQDLDNSRLNRNFLTVVASDDDTDVIIHPKSRSPFNVHLDKAGDVYEYMPQNTEDLTGTYVEIDPASPGNCTKRFAVFSGSTSVTIACGTSRDPLYQQLYPVTSWGKSYCIVPFKDRRYYFRVLAEEDNTLVAIGNSVPIVLNKGMFYTSPMAPSEAIFVSANKKISVAEYALSQDCSGAVGSVLGDPDMVLLNPIEFNIKSITLFSSNLQDIREKYINVSMKSNATSTFKINGQSPGGTWTSIPGNPEFSYIQIRTFDQGSTLTASEGFNAIAYGFGDHESYAYSAGTNLAANTYLLVSNTDTDFDSPNACKDQKSDFKIVLPYKALKITWQLDDGLEFVGNTDPREFSGPAGDLLYEYKYEKKHIFTTLEKHSMLVRTEKPNTTDCLGSEIEYVFTFEVYPLPTTDFEAVAEACADYEVTFTDKSDSHIPDKPYNKWLWDFDDGEPPSTEQNPKHIFREGRVFRVRLRAGLDDGCMDEMIREISIKPRILADFKVNPVECFGADVVVQDMSTVKPAGRVIDSWIWDFGDGSAIQMGKEVRHKYSRPGEYQIKLIAGSDNGCESLVRVRWVVIKELPVANFSLPKVCPNDLAVFSNLSTHPDLSTTGLTYRWDFGDPDTGLDNFDTKKDGVHRYTKAGPYNVQLIVSTVNGCADTISRIIIVNSSFIDARFAILNREELCSDKKVTLVNISKIQIGEITKIVIYKDDTDPGQTFENPKFNETYELEYPAATSAQPRAYTIRMRAYSGINCFVDAPPQLITIYPAPVVLFSQIPPVCLNAGKIVLTQGREMLGVAGVPFYSGPGTTSDGTFDPEAAGIGSHMIKYSFKTELCEGSDTRMINVYPIPTATLPSDLFAYAGEKLPLDLRALGKNLSFQWTPSVNLDRNDIQNPTVTVDSERSYTVTISSSDGCAIKKQIFVHTIPEVESGNAFSPNGDGINDTWVIKNAEIYLNASVEIFNRYGVRIYSSKGFYRPFDGKYKDMPLPVGTYYYIINPNNGRKIVTGSLTLIR